jgi:activator-of-BECN1-regulated-autophagy protein 1
LRALLGEQVPQHDVFTYDDFITFQILFRATDHFFMGNTPSSMLLTHRIQAWDFSKGDIPDLTDSDVNLVVPEAKIHNDASVDISEDGTLLVTLVPSNLPMTTVVGVYSLSPESKGRLYATYSLESSAVSVSLSPTSKHLMVGLALRAPRISLSPSDRSLMAQIFRIKMPWENPANNNTPVAATTPTNTADQDEQQRQQQQQQQRGRLIHRRDLHQNEAGQTSLNCIRWIPVAGLGLVYATNTGLLKILR